MPRYKPKAVVSTERLGAGADGNVHTATGLPLTGPKSAFQGCIDIGDVVVEANKRKIFSVGIGDHGNELGFGTIYDTVVKTMPKGKALATVVKTDVVVPAMMSNWGCYGIEACLAYLLREPQLIHTPEMEKRIVRPASMPAGWKRCTAPPTSWSTGSTARPRWPACSTCPTSCARTSSHRERG